LTFPGAPSIYYGDEVGLPGRLDPDSRRGFPLEAHWELDVLDYHRQLIFLRHAYSALRTGAYQVLFAQAAVYVFVRILGTEELIVAVNTGTAPAKVSIEADILKSQPSKLLYGSAEVEWSVEVSQLELSLPARTGCILGQAT
jgi:glycosidase